MTHARRIVALSFATSILGLTASMVLGPNIDLGLSNDVRDAIAGIEGEEIPLPTRSQISRAQAHG